MSKLRKNAVACLVRRKMEYLGASEFNIVLACSFADFMIDRGQSAHRAIKNGVAYGAWLVDGV